MAATLCCSAGGAMKSAHDGTARDIARMQMAQTAYTGADIRVSAYPFCGRNLRDGAESRGGQLPVVDTVKLIGQAIIEQNNTIC